MDASCRGAREMVPFVLPWNDASQNITNISSWSAEPAGSSGYLYSGNNGELMSGNKRFRLWGVNITGSACFPTHEQADQVAARLARFGINAMRFHHMNAPWLGNNTLIDYSKGNSRSLNPQNLDRLHYFMHALKQNGIYTNLNLLVSRKFSSGDGLSAEINQLDWKESHGIGYFNQHHLLLQKEYASQLLESHNPYTGLALGKDAAIAAMNCLSSGQADRPGSPSVTLLKPCGTRLRYRPVRMSPRLSI